MGIHHEFQGLSIQQVNLHVVHTNLFFLTKYSYAHFITTDLSPCHNVQIKQDTH